MLLSLQYNTETLFSNFRGLCGLIVFKWNCILKWSVLHDIYSKISPVSQSPMFLGHVLTEGFCAKRAYIPFWVDFLAGSSLFFGRRTCFDMKNIFHNCFRWLVLCFLRNKIIMQKLGLLNKKQKKPFASLYILSFHVA